MAGRALTIDINTKDAQTLAALKRIQKELKDTGSSAAATKKQSKDLGDVLKGVALGAGLKMSIDEFEEAQVSAAQTAAVIKSTGNAAEVSAAQQDKMVASLSDLAAIDDEVIAGGANMLRTFTNIKKDAFEPTLRVSQDLASAMGTDLQASIIQVGKALNDPSAGLSKLTKIGVTFTDQQKAQVKALQESGDTLGAQKVILAELQKEFGGSAEANATSSMKMKVAFGNAAESLGGSLAPAMETGAKAAELLSAGFQKLPPGLQQVAVLGLAAAVVGPKLAHGWEQVKDATTGAEGSTNKFGKALGALGIAGAVLGLAQMGDEMTKFKIDTEGVLKSTTGELATMATSLSKIGAGFAFADIKDLKVLYAMRDAVKETGGEALPELEQAIADTEAAEKRGNAASAKYGAQQEATTGAVEDGADAQASLTDGLAATTDEMTKQAAAAQGLFDSHQAATQAQEGVADSVRAVADAQRDVSGAEDGVADAQRGVAEASKGVATARRGVADAEKAVGEAVKGVADAQRGAEKAARDVGAAQKDAADAAAELVAAQREAATGSKELERANKGVVAAEEAVAEAQRRSLTAQEDLTRARADAAEQLEDLDRAARSAVLGEADAIDDLAEAKEKLANLGKDKDGNATDEVVTAREKAQAARDIEKAQIALEAAQDRNQDTTKKLTEEQAKGVEGSDAVVSAKDAIKAAAEGEKTAQENLVAAHEAVAAAQEQMAERVVAAQEKVVDANQKVVDANAALVEANGRVVAAQDGVAAAQLRVRDASEAVAAALDGVGAAQKRVTEAKDGVVAARAAVEAAELKVGDAIKASIDKQQELDAKTKGVQEATKTQIEKYKELAAQLDPSNPLRQNLLGLAAALTSVAGVYDITLALHTLGEGASPGAKNAERQGRASGGPVSAGREYRVNESGQEFFTPDQNGTIHPSERAFDAAQRRRSVRSAAAGGSVTVNVTVPERLDPVDQGRDIGRSIAEVVQLAVP